MPHESARNDHAQGALPFSGESPPEGELLASHYDGSGDPDEYAHYDAPYEPKGVPNPKDKPSTGMTTDHPAFGR